MTAGRRPAVVGGGLALLVQVDAALEASMRGRSFSLAAVFVVSLATASHQGSDAQELRTPQSSAQWPLMEGRGVCFAFSGWCPIDGSRIVGEACYCTIGPGIRVYGSVIAYWYRGHVNPYFNFHTQSVPPTIR